MELIASKGSVSMMEKSVTSRYLSRCLISPGVGHMMQTLRDSVLCKILLKDFKEFSKLSVCERPSFAHFSCSFFRKCVLKHGILGISFVM